MRFKTNAISCPWAMMIHPHHTLLTDATMMSPGWFEIIAFATPPPADETFVALLQSNHHLCYFGRLLLKQMGLQVIRIVL